jgi:hypothetical protein
MSGGPRPGQSDPLGSFLLALGDLWGSGLQALDAMARGGQHADPRFGGMPDASAAMDAGQAAMSQMSGLSPALLQAYGIAGASALRYWRTLSELQARYQTSLARAFADRMTGQSADSPEACRAVADELRAFLREVGDAAAQEARRLQAELEEVGEAIARTAGAASPMPEPPRRRRPHRVKE